MSKLILFNVVMIVLIINVDNRFNLVDAVCFGILTLLTIRGVYGKENI